MTPTQKERLSPKEAADRLTVSLSLVYALLRARKLPGYRIGVGRGKWVIERDDVEAFLERCRQGDRPRLPELKHIR